MKSVSRLLRVLLLIVLLQPVGRVAAAGPATYHVDCVAGSDGAPGTSPAQAWRTLAPARRQALAPGDRILLKRTCTFTGPLVIRASGTAVTPIIVGAYGSGARPMIQNGFDQVAVFGSHVIIENLTTRADATSIHTACKDARMGQRYGIHFYPGASFNTVRYSVARELQIGIYVDAGSHHNTIVNNVLVDNNMKSDDLRSDAGAVGIGLLGDDNEVAYNTISGSTVCSQFYGRDGSAVEVYGGQRNRVHHNRAVNNNTFTELGNRRAVDNTFAYNRVHSTVNGHFLTTRGSRDLKYGPVFGTRVTNNSVYLTGSGYAMSCYGGCGPAILSFRNNIIWSEGTVHADAPFDEGHNIYWRTGGSPKVSFAISATSRKVNPRWVSVSTGDLRLQSTSPAIDAGSLADFLLSGSTSDQDGVAVPQGVGVDIGAYERVAP